MNMNKTTIAVIAAVAILLTVSCVGVTYSWFSDKEETQVSFDPATMEVKVKDNKYTIKTASNEQTFTSVDGKIPVGNGIVLEPWATYTVKYTVEYDTNVSSASVRTTAIMKDVDATIVVKYDGTAMNGWNVLDMGKKTFEVTIDIEISPSWNSEQALTAKPVLNIVNEITQTAAITTGA